MLELEEEKICRRKFALLKEIKGQYSRSAAGFGVGAPVSEDVVVAGLFFAGMIDCEALLRVNVLHVASLQEPLERVRHHRLGVLAVKPDGQALVQHLSDLVEPDRCVVLLEGHGRLAPLAAAQDWTEVLLSDLVHLHPLLPLSAVHSFEVLSKIASGAQLHVAERAVVLELSGSAFGLPWSLACDGRSLPLLDVEGFRDALRLAADHSQVPDDLVG